MTSKAQTPLRLCRTCKGKGWKPSSEQTGLYANLLPCPACHGTGRERKS